MSFRARKVDDNQRAVVKALEAHGCRVQSLASVGNGCPDLVVGYRGRLYLLEVKNRDGRGLGLTEAEAAWHQRWAGMVAVVDGIDQALLAVGIRKPQPGCMVCQAGSLEHPIDCPCLCHAKNRRGE